MDFREIMKSLKVGLGNSSLDYHNEFTLEWSKGYAKGYEQTIRDIEVNLENGHAKKQKTA